MSECEPGFYCTNGIKTPCPENTYGDSSKLTSNVCSGSCKMGEFSTPGSKICSCAPTYEYNWRRGYCMCPPGTFRDPQKRSLEGRQQPLCTRCERGKVNKNYGQNGAHAPNNVAFFEAP